MPYYQNGPFSGLINVLLSENLLVKLAYRIMLWFDICEIIIKLLFIFHTIISYIYRYPHFGVLPAARPEGLTLRMLSTLARVKTMNVRVTIIKQ